MISDLLGPALPRHFCNFAAAPSSAPIPTVRSKPQQKEQFKLAAVNTLPLHCLSIWYQTASSASIWNHFLSLPLYHALPLFFLIPSLPFLVLPYYHFLETSCCLPVRFCYRFTCRPRINTVLDSKRQFFRKDGLPLATQHDLMTKKTPNRQFPKQPFSHTERRGSRRCKITQLMRIRPSDPEQRPL